MNTTFFSALAEPNRMRIVELLREGPLPVGEIAVQLRIRQPQASKHLRVLNEVGLVKINRVAQQHIYQLRSEHFEELESWLETFRHIWETRLDNLNAFMQELKEDKRRRGT